MKNTLVSLSTALQWRDDCARHSCTQYFSKANLWRDILPMSMSGDFDEAEEGMEVHGAIGAGEVFEAFDPSQVKTIRRSQFNTSPHPGLELTPQLGRFYPRNFVRNEPAITADDRRPMRVAAIDDEHMDIDLNSPLAPFTLQASIKIDRLLPPVQEHGGRCNDFVYDMLQTGVGMQSCFAGQEDFFSGQPFARMDEGEDSVFYHKPRLVQHLDATARRHIEDLYQGHLQPGMRVLDLMSSWVSHLPATDDVQVTGLGMNAEELRCNERLSDYVVLDLNALPSLPFAEHSFDRVVCTASVEYLVKPVEVFCEVARCLKPGGKFMLTFSDRWFPPKAIRLWSELHPLERIALVVEYFRQNGRFNEIETLTLQHYPRAADDKYSGQLAYSDPVYAVWATVSG